MPHGSEKVRVCDREFIASQESTAVCKASIQSGVGCNQFGTGPDGTFFGRQLTPQRDVLRSNFRSDEGQQLLDFCALQSTARRDQTCFRMLVGQVGGHKY